MFPTLIALWLVYFVFCAFKYVQSEIRYRKWLRINNLQVTLPANLTQEQLVAQAIENRQQNKEKH